MSDQQKQVKRVTMGMAMEDYERMKELQDMLGLENGATAVSSALLVAHRLAERTRDGAKLYVQGRDGSRERVIVRLRPRRKRRSTLNEEKATAAASA